MNPLERIARLFGVDELPLPLPAGRIEDDVARRLPPGIALAASNISVLLDLDLDSSGHVTRVEVVTPAVRPGVQVRAVLLGAGDASLSPSTGLPPGPLRDAVVATMRDRVFRPARRAGQAVPFAGFRMTVILDGVRISAGKVTSQR